MNYDFQLMLDLMDRGLVEKEQLATLRFEALRQHRPLAEFLVRSRVLSSDVIDEFDRSPSLDDIDLAELDIEDCSQCKCSRKRAQRVVNSLLVDAYASHMDVCIVGEKDATRVYGCGESLEEVFSAEAEDFDHVMHYLQRLLAGDQGHFCVPFSKTMSVEFWAEVDESAREITILVGEEEKTIMVELPDELLEDLIHIEQKTRLSLGPLIAHAWETSGEDVLNCPCLSNERACCATRTGVEVFLPPAVVESATAAARKFGVPRDFLFVRAVIMTRELIARQRANGIDPSTPQ